MKLILSALLAASLFPIGLNAADLGDPAPEIKIAKWVKGEPAQISDNEKGIYVVEFWATWCPPCRTSIPHLTEIQNRFKDKNVTIIGVTDEKEGVVKPFVDKLGSKMDYRVAIDQGATAAGYMKAYGINGIPHAFIVQNKKVIWHGHPMAGLDNTLEEVVSGKYDLAKAKAKMKAETLMDQFREAAAEGDDSQADKVAAEIQAAIKDGVITEQFDPAKEKKEIRLAALKNKFRAAEFGGQKEKAEQAAKEIKAMDPTFEVQELRDEMAMHKLANTYFEAITSETKSDYKKMGAELAPKLKGQPELANNIAWAILTNDSVKERDTEFATRVAKQAVEDTNWKAAHIIDTYARALFDSGKKQEAIEAQEKALAVAQDAHKADIERTLKSYKEGKVPTSE
jgi:thiol-disulfide isomerase/thioredoxin